MNTKSRIEFAPSKVMGQDLAELLGRLLLGAIFLISGFGKVTAYAHVSGYMNSFGIPAALLPLVILTEIAGSLTIILGYKTRVFALLLAGFTLAAGLIFHPAVGNQGEFIHLLKNLAISGGLLVLWRNGPGKVSVDSLLDRKRSGAHIVDSLN